MLGPVILLHLPVPLVGRSLFRRTSLLARLRPCRPQKLCVGHQMQRRTSTPSIPCGFRGFRRPRLLRLHPNHGNYMKEVAGGKKTEEMWCCRVTSEGGAI